MGISALDELRTIKNLTFVWSSFWKRTGGKSGAGIDGVDPAKFREQLTSRLASLKAELDEGYAFRALRGVAIPKSDPTKLRLICVPTVADRLVQRALLNIIEPRSSQLGIANDVSFGFLKRPGPEKGGVQGARQAAVRLRQSNRWVFKADISKFFDDISRKNLAEDFCRALRLRSLLPLIKGAISCEVQADDDRVRSALRQNNIVVGHGLRQGMPISPLLSNFVLRNFDKVIASSFSMVRYADDLVVFADTEASRDRAAEMVEHELEKLSLRLSSTKTFRHSPDEAVEFLGMALQRRLNGPGYHLVITEGQMREVMLLFRRYHSSEHCDKDGLNAAKLFKKLEQMRIGYHSAYWGADNIADFEGRLDRWSAECARKVYGSIFGHSAMQSLTKPQRRFLMLA